MFVGQAHCSGSEQHFVDCRHEPPQTDCESAGAICGKNSSEKTYFTGLISTMVCPSSIEGKEPAVARVVAPVVVVIVLIMAGAVALLVLLSFKLYRKRQIKRMQLDILAK